MTELSQKKKKRSRIIWITALTVCLLVITAISIALIRNYRRKRLYTRYIEEGDRCYQAKEYDRAIAAYKSALSIDHRKPEPYTGLGDSYIGRAEYSMARIYLKEGYENTHEKNMLVRLDEIEGLADGEVMKSLEKDYGEADWNNELISDLAYYTYEQYSREYQAGTTYDAGGQYEVPLRQISARAYYDKSAPGNGGQGGPGEGSVPSYLVFDDLSIIFSEWDDDGLTPEEIEVVTLEKPEIRKEGRNNWLVFSYLNCTFNIECDGEGVVSSPTALNKVVPHGQSVTKNMARIQGTVINATDGTAIEGVVIDLEDSDTDDGLGSSGSDGSFALDTESGDVVLTFKKEGFMSVTKSVSLTANSTEDLGNIPMSPTLEAGKWRIVMSWTGEPQDLDLHVKSDNIYVSYKTPKDSGPDGEKAELDTDEQTGGGVETITITNMRPEEEYAVYVKDFTNRDNPDNTVLGSTDAQVEIYNAEGLVWSGTVPDGTGTIWDVCTIAGGEVRADGAMESERSDLY